jgi:hypothetical protein
MKPQKASSPYVPQAVTLPFKCSSQYYFPVVYPSVHMNVWGNMHEITCTVGGKLFKSVDTYFKGWSRKQQQPKSRRSEAPSLPLLIGLFILPQYK